MMMDKLIGAQSVIITLDVDAFLFERLTQIAQVGFSVIELNTLDANLFQKIIHDFPTLRIGAGNITNLGEKLLKPTHILASNLGNN